MNKRLFSIAPGKIFVAGEYAGIFEREVLLSGINRHTRVEVCDNDGGRFDIRSDYFADAKLESSTTDLYKLWERAKLDFSRYLNTEKIEKLREYRSYNLGPAALATARALAYVEKEIGTEVSGEKIRVSSDLPVGCGMGSSASLCAAIIGGILSIFDVALTKELLNKLTYEVEQVLNGKPSGGDNSAVVYGGWISYRRNGGSYEVKELYSKMGGSGWWILDGGKPDESSLDMINKVVTLSKQRPKYFTQLLNRETEIITNVNKMIISGEVDYNFLNESELILEKMGVVGDKGIKMIREIWQTGGYAKISGAGGIANGVGTILVYLPDLEKMAHITKKIELDYQKVMLGEKGWHIEK